MGRAIHGVSCTSGEGLHEAFDWLGGAIREKHGWPEKLSLWDRMKARLGMEVQKSPAKTHEGVLPPLVV